MSIEIDEKIKRSTGRRKSALATPPVYSFDRDYKLVIVASVASKSRSDPSTLPTRRSYRL